MIIHADEEGKKAITQICNLALKQIATQAQAEMRSIADAVQPLPKKKPSKRKRK